MNAIISAQRSRSNLDESLGVIGSPSLGTLARLTPPVVYPAVGRGRRQVVERRPVLPGDSQDVAETGGGDQPRPDAVPFVKRGRGGGGAGGLYWQGPQAEPRRNRGL